MMFDVSMGLRRSDRKLKQELEAALEKRRKDIDAVLVSYGVPLLQPE